MCVIKYDDDLMFQSFFISLESRVGRHTNLFKQNVRSACKKMEQNRGSLVVVQDNDSNESNDPTFDSGDSNLVEEDSLLVLNCGAQETSIEDALDNESKNIINNIHEAFVRYQSCLADIKVKKVKLK